MFAGGCTLPAAEAICTPDGHPAVDVLDGIEALLDASLLALEETPGGEPRFRMLETVREYAAELLEASGEGAAIRQAHATHFLAFAEAGRTKLSGPGTRSRGSMPFKPSTTT